MMRTTTASFLLVVATYAARATAAPPVPHHWRVYLESDISYPGRQWQPLAGGQSQMSATDACGESKFAAIWTKVDSLVDLVDRRNGRIDIVAMLDTGAKNIASADFNLTSEHPMVADLLKRQKGGMTSVRLARAIQDIRQKIGVLAKTSGRKIHAQELISSAQHTQNIFAAVDDMRANVDAALRDSSGATMVFISDLLHYNTSQPGQVNLEAGQLNMLDTRERAALIKAQRAKDSWWLLDHPLTPMSQDASHKVDIWTVNVERCSSGEALPGLDRANWAAVYGDVRTFWTTAFRALGVPPSDVAWNYSVR